MNQSVVVFRFCDLDAVEFGQKLNGNKVKEKVFNTQQIRKHFTKKVNLNTNNNARANIT